MLIVRYSKGRPGEGWHAHGTTSKQVWLLVGWQPIPARLIKQRWLHVESGRTRHDKPFWDRPGCVYAMDVVIATLTVWLHAAVPLRKLHWGWDDLRPDPRTVTRWAAQLRPGAHSWLQHARAYFIEVVRPKALDDVLPAGGIPPPRRRRCRSQDNVQLASQLSDVAWLHEKVARAIHIPLRMLLEGACWRHP